MKKEEFSKVIELHGKWLRNEEGGERADLSWANISGANLSGANLSGADLSWADLSRADLSRADLSRADLSGAKFYLTGFNLGCGSLKIGKCSDDLFYQLIYHAASLPVSDDLKKPLYDLANKFSLVSTKEVRKL